MVCKCGPLMWLQMGTKAGDNAFAGDGFWGELFGS